VRGDEPVGARMVLRGHQLQGEGLKQIPPENHDQNKGVRQQSRSKKGLAGTMQLLRKVSSGQEEQRCSRR